MKVGRLMTREVEVCKAGETLNRAASSCGKVIAASSR